MKILSPTQTALIEILSDGHYHSGEKLGQALGLTRTAIWKHIHFARETLQLPITSKTGKGYHLIPAPLLLDRKYIWQGLSPEYQTQLLSLDCYSHIDSTSQHLYQRICETERRPRLCIAEMQTAGIGRRGQTWQSPYGYNVYYSLLWHFQHPPQALLGLSIMLAIIACRLLTAIPEFPPGIELKWPNDIFFNGKKLAGVLVEMRAQNTGTSHCVMSIGINGFLPPNSGQQIEQTRTDHYQITGQVLDRNVFIRDFTNELFAAIPLYLEQGLTPFQTEWSQYDRFYQQPITLIGHDQTTRHGIAQGITPEGLLKFKCSTTGETLAVHSGQYRIKLES